MLHKHRLKIKASENEVKVALEEARVAAAGKVGLGTPAAAVPPQGAAALAAQLDKAMGEMHLGALGALDGLLKALPAALRPSEPAAAPVASRSPWA
eukprot:5714295-Pyramimonas_sp.AAC.1